MPAGPAGPAGPAAPSSPGGAAIHWAVLPAPLARPPPGAGAPGAAAGPRDARGVAALARGARGELCARQPSGDRGGQQLAVNQLGAWGAGTGLRGLAPRRRGCLLARLLAASRVATDTGGQQLAAGSLMLWHRRPPIQTGGHWELAVQPGLQSGCIARGQRCGCRLSRDGLERAPATSSKRQWEARRFPQTPSPVAVGLVYLLRSLPIRRRILQAKHAESFKPSTLGVPFLPPLPWL